MKNILSVLLLGAGLAFGGISSFAQEAAQDAAPVVEEVVVPEGPVTALLEVFRVATTQNSDGTTSESLEAAKTATPGDILQYVGTYTNVSESDVAGLILNGPIPASTTYVEESQSGNQAGVLEVLITGEDWQELPAYKTVKDENGKDVRVEAVSADYTQLRWRLSGPLVPETSAIVKYRVRVNG